MTTIRSDTILYTLRAKVIVKKITTRVIETEIGEGRYNVTYPAVDMALQTIAMHTGRNKKFTGPIKTSWCHGGMTEPQLFETPKRGGKYKRQFMEEFVVSRLRPYLPDKFTGIAIFHSNNGELSGEPEILAK